MKTGLTDTHSLVEPWYQYSKGCAKTFSPILSRRAPISDSMRLSHFHMSSHITPQQYGQAVLEHVQSGAYPDSEEVISAELPASALPEVSKLLEQAKEDVKVWTYEILSARIY